MPSPQYPNGVVVSKPPPGVVSSEPGGGGWVDGAICVSEKEPTLLEMSYVNRPTLSPALFLSLFFSVITEPKDDTYLLFFHPLLVYKYPWAFIDPPSYKVAPISTGLPPTRPYQKHRISISMDAALGNFLLNSTKSSSTDS
jgi:hypothetical protein